MSQIDPKAKIKASIWQSIAQSNVPVSAVPKDQMNTLVDAVADGVIAAMREMLGQAGQAVPGETEPERLLWKGRPLLSLVERYEISTERLTIIKGLLSVNSEDIELLRVQDVDYKQNLFERILGRGDVEVQSHDPTASHVFLRNVAKPKQVNELLRRAMINVRKRTNFGFREEM